MIGFFNCEEQLVRSFPNAKVISIEDNDFPEIDGLVIDWVLSDRKNPSIPFARQASLIEKYVKKGVPTFIFDRFSSITFKESKWLKKFNVNFFEPLLMHRDGFKYLPFWTYGLYDLDNFEKDQRIHDISFKGYLKDKIKSFEEYYINISMHFPHFSIAYDSYLIKSKTEEYKNNGVNKVENLDMKQSKTSIIIGSSRDYKLGKLDQLYVDSLNNGCLPIVAKDNRFYMGLEPTLIPIDKENGTSRISRIFFESTSDIRYGILMGIHEKLDRYFPEMKVNHAIDVIKNTIGE